MQKLEQLPMVRASARAWFNFAVNSSVLTERQRCRIFSGLTYKEHFHGYTM